MWIYSAFKVFVEILETVELAELLALLLGEML